MDDQKLAEDTKASNWVLENVDPSDYVNKAPDSLMIKAFKAGRASMREEVNKDIVLVKQKIYKRLKMALERGSGFTFEQEDMILLGVDMAIDELLKPFAESGK